MSGARKKFLFSVSEILDMVVEIGLLIQFAGACT